MGKQQGPRAWINVQFDLTMQAKASGLEVLVDCLVPAPATTQEYQLDH